MNYQLLLKCNKVHRVGDAQAIVAATHANQLQTVLLSTHRLDQRQAENHQQVQANISELQKYGSTQFGIINRNTTQYSLQPVR
jgi:hypothetical protein